ncbi:CaiB/BaiF CoA-transferase family protein [Bosea sp. ASV33]|uniref:CaiB/BaiF CoA transferase family protein n=1 Tax=Bosea sp. ASV33 TaxID=2795106 RepID=UPI0018EC57CA|nr:CaiB/BaiF CoA-transferase family protein [Bosea sp. ASV33]
MGPLAGLKVIELAGLGPTPFCGMLLGDLGADVLRVDRLSDTDLGIAMPGKFDLRNRNKRSVALDIKSLEGLRTLLALVEKADILIEGFRPGVAERLGFGPEACLQCNPRLVYGRATGWGQEGPMSQMAGHDINYIALTGALNLIGPADGPPVPPLNLLGDYGGGGIYMAFGLMAAVYESARSGQGQVVDCAMVDGVTSLLTVFHAFRQLGQLAPRRGANVLDGGAPFYRCYETRDGGHVAIGCIEKRFYDTMLRVLDLSPAELPDRDDRANWPQLCGRFAEIFRQRTRDEWSALFEGSDACFSPVLTLDEAGQYPHNRARSLIAEVDGVEQPGPTPRFSRTPGGIGRPAPDRGAHTQEILEDWGIATS